MERIKVLYIITALNIGGAEMMLYRMLKTLNRKKFEVVVVSLIDKGPLGEAIQSELGIKVYALGLKGFNLFFRALKDFGKVVRDYKPDIVHSHMFHANIISRLLRIFFRFPVLINTIHNLDEKGRRKSAVWRERAYCYTDRLADFTTQVSRAGLEKYLHIGVVAPGRFAYIPNGIDLSLFEINTGLDANLRQELSIGNGFVFLAVGSLTVQKNYPNLLQAFFEVSKKEPGAVLVIVGDGPLKTEITELIKKMGLMEKVLLLGLRKDVPKIMKMADCFVMSSAWEGLPIVLLEAAAAGLPIIATDVGGNSEVVMDGENGFVVDSEDSLALAKAMLKMVKMPEDKRKEFGVKAYNHVKENYDIKVIATKWEGIYSALAEGKKPETIIQEIT